MKLLSAMMLVLLASSPLFAQVAKNQSWPPEDTFEFMESTVAKEFWTGGVIAWIDGDKSGIRSFGRLSRQGDKKIDENTIFEIGSISKVFATTLLCRAIRDGKLQLTDTLADVFPEGTKLSATIAAITLEELATHTSGLPRLPFNMTSPSSADPYADYSRGKLLEFLSGYEVDPEAKGKVAYSNLGTGVIGTVLEILYNKPFVQLVQELICKPLKMTSTSGTGQGANQAQGHSGKLPVSNWKFDALAAAGDLVSNAKDMLSFARVCLNQSESEIGKAIGVASKMRETISKEMRVGLGWHSFEKDGNNVIWHNGGTGGFSTFLGFDKGAKRAFFAAVNSNGPEVTPLGFHSFVPAVPLPTLPSVVKLKNEELAPCAGRFRLEGGLILEVAHVDDFLTVTIPGQATFTLYPSALNEYFLLVAAVRCHFIPGKNDDIAALVWSQGGVNQRAPRVEGDEKAIEVPEAELKRLTGRYQLDKDNVITVRVHQGKLEAQLTNQPFLKLRATSKTDFVFEIVDARLAFELKEEGQARSVTMKQNKKEKRAPRIE